MRVYTVKVGDTSQPTIQTRDRRELCSFLLGLLVGDGWGVERAGAITEDVSQCLEAGGILGDPVVLLTDSRPVRVKAEEVTEWRVTP